MTTSSALSRRTGQGRCVQGFTLIELMIAVVIVGVLAALAYPSFLDSIRKGRRAEAFTAITAVQQAQERWRSNNATYTTVLLNTAPANLPPDGLGVAAATPSGYYSLSVQTVSATAAVSYTVTATALSGTSQANDGNCKVLGAQATGGGNLKYGSGASSIDWTATDPDAGRCWAR